MLYHYQGRVRAHPAKHCLRDIRLVRVWDKFAVGFEYLEKFLLIDEEEAATVQDSHYGVSAPLSPIVAWVKRDAYQRIMRNDVFEDVGHYIWRVVVEQRGDMYDSCC